MRRLALITAVFTLGGVAVLTAMRAGADQSPLSMAPVVVESEIRLAGVVVMEPALPPKPAKKKVAPKAARHRIARARDGQPVPVELTAYCLSGTTRRGRYVRPGIIATDPRVFPLSRYVELFAEGKYLGRYLVDDTGRLIKGAHIDVWVPTCAEAVLFGRVQGTAVLVPRRKQLPVVGGR
ncbi:MAG TPA: 3D domain-containing protein [Gemmatimonadaceae bacterium]|jgi:3D (Asp-Asp-Asp) domain-containing protein|nr:3D domain-containing protein [Gemmatimonadaceae bacterium]